MQPPLPEKSQAPLSHQPPSKNWGYFKPPPFQNLVGGWTSPPPCRKGGRGLHTMLILQFRFLDDLRLCFFTGWLYFHHNWWKERGTKIKSWNIFEGCYWGKKCGNSCKQSPLLDNLNIQKIELLKIKLYHKLPSKQNYLLSKTFTFHNWNSHCPEQICFFLSLCLSLDLSCRESTVASCSRFFSFAS